VGGLLRRAAATAGKQLPNRRTRARELPVLTAAGAYTETTTVPRHALFVVCFTFLPVGGGVLAQLIDRTMAPNTSGDGIALSLTEQVGAGRGDWFTEDSSSFHHQR
jgi:hypothetical protein